MRILQTNFHYGWGGQPAAVLMMSRGLADRGHRVVIAAPRGSLLAQRSRQAGLLTFEACAFLKTKHLASALRDAARLSRHLRAERYDVIHAHGSQDLWTCVSARALARVPVPLVFTRHNTKRVRGHLANRWLYRRQVDHLVVANASVLERYARILECGALRRERVTVVDMAYRPERFHLGVDGSRVRAELGLGPDVPLVGVIGRLVHDKAQDDFLRAAKRVLDRRPEARFILTGTGPQEREFRSLAASLGLSDAVRFLGFRNDVPEIIAALTVSVLPSIDCDASSTVLKESLACGVPAVATAIGGAVEILRPGETGLVVPPRDPGRLAEAILSLLDDPGRAREMGRRGSRDVARRFTPERLTSNILKVYESVVGRRAGRAARTATVAAGADRIAPRP
ncbi:MAG: glycosyltransferase family 4 protein [Acidobacteriota bacterium]